MNTVDEIIARKGHGVFTICASATVLAATQEMAARKIGALVVTDETGKVVGIVTERDVLRRVVAKELSPAGMHVAEVMVKELICAPPGTDIAEASEVMREKHIRHLPVCEAGGKLLGMVSIGDLNACHASRQEQTIHYLNDYIYGRG